MSEAQVRAVVWDVGRVLYHWNLRHLFAPHIADQAELDWFLGNVVTEEWHFEADAGRPLAAMLPERKALFPDHAALIDLYATRFVDSIPGPVAGTHELVAALATRGVPQFALTNFGAEFWAMFRPTAPVFNVFADCVVSGMERCAKPEAAIYEVLEQRCGFAPTSLLFIDDRAENIAAATARGWQGHVFADATTLADDLRLRGLIG